MPKLSSAPRWRLWEKGMWQVGEIIIIRRRKERLYKSPPRYRFREINDDHKKRQQVLIVGRKLNFIQHFNRIRMPKVISHILYICDFFVNIEQLLFEKYVKIFSLELKAVNGHWGALKEEKVEKNNRMIYFPPYKKSSSSTHRCGATHKKKKNKERAVPACSSGPPPSSHWSSTFDEEKDPCEWMPWLREQFDWANHPFFAPTFPCCHVQRPIIRMANCG